mgnify:CR=1 FL=1|jgi:citrate lyase subunit beta / citryl-CoA lyase
MSKTGEAGRSGPKVRSDCRIVVEYCDKGGLLLDISSKVGPMYGDNIRQQITESCANLGIENARVTVEDRGALPFVLDARLETAARRADPTLDATLIPEMRKHCTYTSKADRLRRSRLYLPGNEPKFFVNAGLHNPDGMILDLEDSVAHSEKDAARCMVRNALRVVDFYGAERMVRINQGEMGIADLDWIVPHNVHLILIPKVEDPQQVIDVDNRIKEILKENNIEQSVFLMPIIESALGAWKAYEIAASCESVVSLAIGLEDYTADIGTQRTLEGGESFWARAQVLNGAVAAGVQPIDTVFSDVGDEEGLRNSIIEAKSFGFVGKGCIHPRQIDVVHKTFAPETAELEKAKKIVLAFEDAESKGLGVVSLGSKMIDAPVVKRALRTVDVAIQVGMLNAEWRKEVD